tara:strand:- start:801 stop:980 length:180 start_codon:yes stop_codon:yes gene_type:complete
MEEDYKAKIEYCKDCEMEKVIIVDGAFSGSYICAICDDIDYLTNTTKHQSGYGWDDNEN